MALDRMLLSFKLHKQNLILNINSFVVSSTSFPMEQFYLCL